MMHTTKFGIIHQNNAAKAMQTANSDVAAHASYSNQTLAETQIAALQMPRIVALSGP